MAVFRLAATCAKRPQVSGPITHFPFGRMYPRAGVLKEVTCAARPSNAVVRVNVGVRTYIDNQVAEASTLTPTA